MPRAAAALIVALVSTAAAQQTSPPPYTARIFGQVIRDGRPAAGVKVTLGPSPGLPSAITDEHGNFAIDSLPAGEYFVRPEFAGYTISGDMEHQRLRFAPGDRAQRVDFTLVPAGSIRGRITDYVGAPIENATVFLVRLTERDALVPLRPIPVAKTGRNGGYVFTEVHPGRYTISVRPHYDAMRPLAERDARFDAVYYYPSGTDGLAAEILTVTAETPLTGIDIQCGLAPSGPRTGQARRQEKGSAGIRGYVRLPSGVSPDAIQVLAFRTHDGSTSVERGPINPDGRFVLERLPAGEFRILAVLRGRDGTETRIGRIVVLAVEEGKAYEIEIDARVR